MKYTGNMLAVLRCLAEEGRGNILEISRRCGQVYQTTLRSVRRLEKAGDITLIKVGVRGVKSPQTYLLTPYGLLHALTTYDRVPVGFPHSSNLVVTPGFIKNMERFDDRGYGSEFMDVSKKVQEKARLLVDPIVKGKAHSYLVEEQRKMIDEFYVEMFLENQFRVLEDILDIIDGDMELSRAWKNYVSTRGLLENMRKVRLDQMNRSVRAVDYDSLFPITFAKDQKQGSKGKKEN